MKIKHYFLGLSIIIIALSCTQDKKVNGKQKKQKNIEQAIIWGKPSNGLVLGIQAKKSKWVTKETAEFIVYLKNEGKTQVNIPMFFFGLSTLKLKIINDKGEPTSFMKENLSTQLGESISLSPKQIISASQQVVLSKETWEGSTGKYQVIAIYNTTDFKEKKMWSDKCITETLVFTVK